MWRARIRTKRSKIIVGGAILFYIVEGGVLAWLLL